MYPLARNKKDKDGYFRTDMTVGKNSEGKSTRIIIRAKSREEFDAKVEQAKRLYSRGLSLSKTTVYEWAQRWLFVYKANATAVQKAHYTAKVNHDILPKIGDMRMCDVRASHLQEILNCYAGGKLETVKKIRGAIKQLFSDAELEGIIDRNPAARLELPSLTEKTRRPLTLLEKIAVFEVAKTHKRGAYIMTLLLCGLRRGECTALLVGDVDLANKRLNIDKAISYRYNHGELTTTKSAKLRRKGESASEVIGSRVVPIPDILLPYVEPLTINKPPDIILFPGKREGQYPSEQELNWWWRSYKRQCHLLLGATTYRNKLLTDTSYFGEEISLHYLRHTYATDLYATGVDDKAQKTFLGHSSGDVTDIYRKMNDVAYERASGLINAYYASLCFLKDCDKNTPGNLTGCIKCCYPDREK